MKYDCESCNEFQKKLDALQKELTFVRFQRDEALKISATQKRVIEAGQEFSNTVKTKLMEFRNYLEKI